MNKPLSLLEAHTQLTWICKLSTTLSAAASTVTPYFVWISSLSRLVIASSILHHKWSMKLSLCRFFHFENKFLFLFMLSLLCIATGPHCYLYISCDTYISYVCYVWSMHLFSLYVFPIQTTWCSHGNSPFVFFAHMCRWRRLFPRVVSFGVKWEKHRS